MNLHKEIYSGSKSLSIDITPEAGTATIRFGTRIPAWRYPREEGETTAIFKRADVILSSSAAVLRKSLILRFDTANTNLKKWALANEDELDFDWVEPHTAEAFRVTVQKTYRSND
jgi:hypothetical protein